MVETAEKVNNFMLECRVLYRRELRENITMLIQIYEIQTPEEARMMVDLGIDHIGSVLVSDRQWENPVLKAAIRLVQEAGRKSSLIPLFGQLDRIAEAVAYYKPDILHFCEAFVPEKNGQDAVAAAFKRQAALRERFPEIELMRSIPIGCNGSSDRVPSLELAALFEQVSDWFLTDTLLHGGHGLVEQDQPVQGYVGITGRTCDWEVARALVRQSRIPVILAGGIGPANAADGICRVHPAGVDSCTRTNKVDRHGRAIRFQKDPDKVKAMVAAVQIARETIGNKI
jgi:phosphoribosylanthranilate isomerase